MKIEYIVEGLYNSKNWYPVDKSSNLDDALNRIKYLKKVNYALDNKYRVVKRSIEEEVVT